MAPQNDTDNTGEVLELLTTVLMTAKDFNPDWPAVAAELGINTASNAQRRFKKAIERSGKYECKKSVITKKEIPTAAKSKKRKAPTEKTDDVENKKSKRDTGDENSDVEEDEA